MSLLFRNGWARAISSTLSLMKCVTCWRRFKKRRSRRRMGWEQLVFEFNKITDSAAAKPFTMPIFTSYPLLEEKRLELPRQGESCRRRNITRQLRSCARPGRNNGKEEGRIKKDENERVGTDRLGGNAARGSWHARGSASDQLRCFRSLQDGNENRGQFFALTRVLPTARPVGLPVYVAPSRWLHSCRKAASFSTLTTPDSSRRSSQ